MSVWVNPDVEEIVAGLEGVTAEVVKTANRGARKLKANIAKRTGRMAGSVSAERVGSKDAFFGISDEGALGYNYGHHNSWADEQVQGSYVIEQTVREM
ncbi:DUF5403 family protein [Nonomuraea sp. NPDC049129]|uniref:DUF5403 family protein n=1 Tax=Nonomuraea sp. NPDC049129 TaxID=3155272 RepID=UPI0033E3BDB5